MDDSQHDGAERDRRVAPGTTGVDPAPSDDFYRGASHASVEPTPEGLARRSPRFHSDRPPVWLSISLVLVATLAGFAVFSTVWALAGDGVLAVPLASLAGLTVLAATVLLGAHAWRRTSLAPEPG